MPGPIVHLGATILCGHAGQATPTTPFARVLVGGQPVVTVATPYVIAGCALTGTGSPPCATGQWLVGATRVLAGGVPVAIQSGTSTCVPTGTPMMPVVVQPRVVAT
ncbi:hypothetical protein [Kribbia dieselivorans]|uniref:hypothetical protein n=1 Tax=Kribbia dieselivorans TaxID=331526 RepID=UPI0008392E03|nr:hypothetical protein [Kribbia dieselivorans]